MSELSCQAAEEARLGQSAGELSQDLAQALSSHLAGCTSCQGFSQELNALEADLSAALLEEDDARAERAADLFLAESVGRSPRRWRRHALAAAAGIALTVGLSWTWLSPLPSQTRRAETSLLRAGSLSIARGELQLVASAGTPLREGDLLTTGETSAELALPGGAVLLLAPESRLNLARARAEGRLVRLEAGAVQCRVQPGQGPFAVETRLGSARVLGTEFSVRWLPGISEPAHEQEQAMRVKPRTLVYASGVTSAVAVSVLVGAVLVETADGNAQAEVHANQVGFLGPDQTIEVAELAKLRRQAELGSHAAQVEEELRTSRAELARLKKELAQTAASETDTPPSGALTGSSSQEVAPTQEASPPGSPEAREARIRELVDEYDWESGAQSVIDLQGVRNFNELSLEGRNALSRFSVVITELEKLLGGDKRGDVFKNPRVLKAWLPAWLDALGAKLDDEQNARLSEMIESDAEQRERVGVPPAPTTYAARHARSIRSDVEFDEYLEGLLRPEQLDNYLGSVGDDPFFASEGLSVSEFGRSSLEGLVTSVTEFWLEQLAIDPALRTQVAAQAQGYVSAALALPLVDSTQDPWARRRAALERTATLLELQSEFEARLARELPLSDEERERVAAGTGRLIFIQLETQ